VNLGCFDETRITANLLSSINTLTNVTAYSADNSTFKIYLAKNKDPIEYDFSQVVGFSTDFDGCGAYNVSLVTFGSNNTLANDTSTDI
jgi:hypothetical protein